MNLCNCCGKAKKCILLGPYWLCRRCACTTSFCRECEAMVSNNSMVVIAGMCHACFSRLPAKLIYDYHYRIQHDVLPLGTPKDYLYYGVELEYYTTNLPLDTFLTHRLISKFCCLKHDSTTGGGFEIVSVPCDFYLHQTLWKDFFEKIPRGLVPTETCGMHVHVTRKFTDLELGKMIAFLHEPRNNKFIKQIAGRGSQRHNNFLEKKSYAYGMFGGMILNPERYTALNLVNRNTIEFRLFASTRDFKTFLKNLEFCRALIKYTYRGSIPYRDITSQDLFKRFVSANRRDYPCLYEFI